MAEEVEIRPRAHNRTAGWTCRGIGSRAGFSASLALLALAICSTTARAADEIEIPPPRGFVNDFAGVLDPATVQDLERLITELREKTGSEIAIVTVRSTGPLSAFDYAMRIAERWKPGAAGKDNGVVFLVAVEDRELFILTGYGIEGALPDGLVGEIRDNVIVPRFRAGKPAAGVRAGTEALAGRIAREYGVALSGQPPPRPTTRRKGISPIALFVLVVFLLLLASHFGPLWLGQRGYRRRTFGGTFGGGGFGGPGGGFGGGFGGFGGGGFGGGGAGGRW